MRRRKISNLLSLALSFAMVLTVAAGLSAKKDGDIYAVTQGNPMYSLAGAQYQLYTNAECTAAAVTTAGGNALLTTDASGDTPEAELEFGTYWAKEVVAAPGYLLDPNVQNNPITIDNDSTFTFQSTDMPTVGRLFKLRKYDKDGGKDWKALLGAQYTLKYYAVDPSTTDVSELTPLRTWTFETSQKEDSLGHPYAGIDFAADTPVSGDDFYEAKVQAYRSNGTPLDQDDKDFDTEFAYYRIDSNGTNTRVMPIGVFTVEETKAPKGMARNKTVYYGNVRQPSNGADAVTSINNTDDFFLNVKTGGAENAEDEHTVEIEIEKVVGQTGGNEPYQTEAGHSEERLSGFVTLEGAVYNVYYDDPELDKPVYVGNITTDAEGKGRLTHWEADPNKPLRVGTYFVEEVSAPEGFLTDKYALRDDGTTEEVIGDIEVICGYDDDGGAVKKTISGAYKNGHHIFVARALKEGVAEFTYTLKSKDYETETPITKIDATTGKELPGATLQVIRNGEVIEQWVSTEEAHTVWGLAPGTYTLREITAPYGYDIAEDIEFEVKDNEVVNPVTMENRPIGLGTVANDGESKSHHGIKKADEKLVDTVRVTGLCSGRKYRLTGKLWNRKTESFVKGADDQDLTAASEEFTATAEDAENGKDVEVVFTLDASGFDDDVSLVAYEYLSRTERMEDRDETNDFPDEDFPKDLAKHEKPNDEDQTIHFGGIASTVAVDQKSKGHNMLGEKDAVIVDTVRYENLSTMETYVIEGELYDKTAGKLTGIKGESEPFKPETVDGTVTIEFSFDATAYKGHKLVVYEKLLVNRTVVDRHEEPDDEDQTVYVPEIKTVAVNPENNEHIANAARTITVRDTVTYKCLVPGKTYTLKGTLQYRDGVFNTLRTVMKNGQPLTATTTFTPATENGTIEVTFVFDSVDLAGKTIVIFEDVYEGKFLVASHAEPDDADQSVHIPKIGTKVGRKKGKSVIDTVRYENLIPGKTYTVKGYFVVKSTGKKLSGSDGEVTFVPTTSDGEVKVRLRHEDSGKALVAFESVYIVTADTYGTPKETLVGEHKDLKDKAQTLTEKGAPATGDSVAALAFWLGMFACSSSLAVVGARHFARKREETETLV